MTNEEVVKRLRWMGHENTDAGADRIEALTAKLAKAVEALTFYTCAENGCGNCPEQDRGRVSCGWTARATLAEIEGEKG
jgi:hypothetical protein